MKSLEELNAQGKTVVIITHDPAIGKRCQRIIHILDGQVEKGGSHA
jgi:ABC-type lipoprotein export system ATPase subunit